MSKKQYVINTFTTGDPWLVEKAEQTAMEYAESIGAEYVRDEHCIDDRANATIFRVDGLSLHENSLI